MTRGKIAKAPTPSERASYYCVLVMKDASETEGEGITPTKACAIEPGLLTLETDLSRQGLQPGHSASSELFAASSLQTC